MATPITYNTTCDVFHAATGPGGAVDITAADIQLVPLGIPTLFNATLIGALTPPITGLDWILPTHIALFGDEIDIRDSWDPLSGWTGTSDHLWVPSVTGTCYTVLFVDMLRDLETGVRVRRAWLMRQRVITGGGTGLGWPQQGV